MIYRKDEYPKDSINPFTGQPYNSSWMLYALNENPVNRVENGMTEQGVYAFHISRVLNTQWHFSVCDFAGYCEANHLNAIVVLSDSDYRDAVLKYQNHSYKDPFLREDEPPVLIHSTTEEAWHHIQKDGMLKSWNRLQQEHPDYEQSPIGSLLGDPDEFRQYIMFGKGISSEIVVSSKLSGFINMNFDAPYHTGARLYFDADKMAQDGLLIRDGGHIKVKDTLPLAPYLIWAATWEKLHMNSPISTPAIYAKKADAQFHKLFGNKYKFNDERR